jgi:hypothetical protein
MTASLEAEDATLSLNINIEKENDKYENQNERQSWRDSHEPQPDSCAQLEGQEWRQSRHHRHLATARNRATRNRGPQTQKPGHKPGFFIRSSSALSFLKRGLGNSTTSIILLTPMRHQIV